MSMKYKFGRIKKALNNRLLGAIDLYYDMKICRTNLSRYEPSVFRDDKNGIGSTGSQATSYIILKKIFSHVNLMASDSFIDVGCGKGRVLAFLLKEHCKARLNGIEINKVAWEVANEWTKKRMNVKIMFGDAFKLDYQQYNVLFFGRPFLPKTFIRFIELLESQLTHRITFIYWVDHQSGYMLYNRRGWTIKYHETIQRIHGLQIAEHRKR